MMRLDAKTMDVTIRVLELKDKFEHGQIELSQLENALHDLMFYDGNTWFMVGFDTLRLYFYDDVQRQWELSLATKIL